MAEKTGWTETGAINLNDVSEDAPPPPEKGIYKFEIQKATPVPTSKGDPMIKLTLKYLERHGGEPIGKNDTVFTQLTFKGELALRQLKQFVRATKPVAVAATMAPDDISDYAVRLVGATGWCMHDRKTLGSRLVTNIERFLGAEQVEAAAAGETELENVGTEAAGAASGGRRRRAG